MILDDGETLGGNHYYKTKHGGEIYVSGGAVGSKVGTGAQVDADAKSTPATIEEDYSEANGHAYRINRVIQPTMKSVSRVLQDNSQFSEFYELCSGFAATDLLKWAGISDETNSFGTTEQDQYIIFTSTYGTGNNMVRNACPDENVKMFNTYNYTLYAPDNAAMEVAYSHGLPRWSEVQALFDTYGEDASSSVKAQALNMIKAIRAFCRYHFQSIALYADKSVDGGTYESLYTNSIGVAETYKVSGGDNRITITDGTGTSHTINANDSKVCSPTRWRATTGSARARRRPATPSVPLQKQKPMPSLPLLSVPYMSSHRPCTSTRTHQAKGLGILRSLQPARLRPRPRQEPEQ